MHKIIIILLAKRCCWIWNSFRFFTISITILAGIRERIADNDIPHVLQGSPIVLITAGLMAIVFIGFSD